MPDYMLNRDAVLGDKVNWRHGKVPDYSAANNNFLKGACSMSFCRLHLHMSVRCVYRRLFSAPTPSLKTVIPPHLCKEGVL